MPVDILNVENLHAVFHNPEYICNAFETMVKKSTTVHPIILLEVFRYNGNNGDSNDAQRTLKHNSPPNIGGQPRNMSCGLFQHIHLLM